MEKSLDSRVFTPKPLIFSRNFFRAKKVFKIYFKRSLVYLVISLLFFGIFIPSVGSTETFIYGGTDVYNSGNPLSEKIIVRNSSGSLWMTFADYTTNILYISNSSDSGLTWTNTIVEKSTLYRPALCVDSKDVIHLVYYNFSNGFISYTNSTSNFVTKTSTGSFSDSVAPTIAVDGNDKLHLAYVNITAGGISNICYTNSLDGVTWSNTINLTVNTLVLTSVWQPVIVINASNAVHVIHFWEVSVLICLLYDTWSNDGVTFTNQEINTTTIGGWHPGFVNSGTPFGAQVDDNDVLHLIVQRREYNSAKANDVLHLSNASGQSWVKENMTGLAQYNTAFNSTALSISSNGSLYAFAVNERGVINYSVNYSSGWSAPQTFDTKGCVLYSLGSYWPYVSSKRFNRPNKGYATVFVTVNQTCFKYNASEDLAWDTGNFTLSGVSPTNGSTGVSLVPSCHVTVNNQNGGIMSLLWYENTTGAWVLRQTNSSCTNGTYYWSFTQANTASTKYYWKVFVNDTTPDNLTSIFEFTSTSPAWYTMETINGSLFNRSSWGAETDINGSFFNLSLARTVETLNGSIFNISHTIQVTSLNGSLFNISVVRVITTLNGSIFNLSLSRIVETINGSIFNRSEIYIHSPLPLDTASDITISAKSLYVIVNITTGGYLNATWWSNWTGTWRQFGDNGTFFSNTNITVWATNFSNYSVVYYWSVNATSDSSYYNKTFYFTTVDAPVPFLVDLQEPKSGKVNGTFYFNLSYCITDDDHPDIIRVNITMGTWYDNSSLVWYEGENDTWANYTYNRSFTIIGPYTYTFYVDSGNATNYTTGTFTTTTDIWLSLYFPLYIELGEYVMATGSVTNSTGEPLNDAWIYTQFYNSSGTAQLVSPLRLRCMDGEYWLTITSTIFLPNNYTIWVNFTDPLAGNDYNASYSIYIGSPGGPGHYTTPLHFTFYNNNSGIGLNQESFKVYVNASATLSSTDRIYGDTYFTYTGQTLYYRVDDYFDLQVYPNVGTYETVVVTEVNQFEDVPIDWFSFGIQNMNHSVVKVTLTNGSRTYTQYLFPYEQYYWDLLVGTYSITKQFYEPASSSLLQTEYTNVTIANDTYYWIAGYSRQDLICNINDIENRSVLLLSFYNTNEGLGLPDETLKIYLNGTRYKENIFYVQNGTIVNVTIKDYYNQTLYWGNHTINSDYIFLDLGLTFHSYKFCNMNEEYYMISFLKDNATRWYERGVCPYETIEYLLPSGLNYTLRIYNASLAELCNFSVDILNSKLYMINGTNLSLIIDGQSVIIGQLLQLSVELGIATMADIVSVGYNVPYVYSLFDREGQVIGNNVIKICPAQIMMATAYNETWSNNTISPLIPDNTTANGTIMLQSLDRVWFHGGNSTYVNITSRNGTYIQNTTYIPSFYDPNGEVLIINTSENMSITRESRFQQVKKFYWTKYVDQGKYTATINFTNPMISTIKEVFLFIEFANDTTPDYNTVEVYDVTNGIYLREGEHFDASSTGVHLALTSIEALSQRLFTVIYYQGEDVKQPSDAIVVLDDWGTIREYNGRNYYYLRAQWVNTREDSFVGPIYVQFNFSSDFEIARETIAVYDVENVKYLQRDEFAYTESGILVSQETVGEVSPQSVRTFEIYYLHVSEETPVDEVVDEIKGFMDTELFKLPYIGSFLGIHLIVCILFAIGLLSVAGKKNYKEHLWVLAVCLFFIFLAVMAWLQPVG